MITDLHFNSKNGSQTTFKIQMEFFELQFFPYIISNNIKEVICLGDVFDSRDWVDWYILQELKKRFFSWFEQHKIKLHVVVGNHDSVFRNTLSHHAFKETFNEYTYCVYYDVITKVEIGKYTFAMVPWLCGEREVVFPKADICIGHFEIQTFAMVKGCECKDGFDTGAFKDFQLTFSGHFHIRNTYNNGKHEICYIGNPYQKDWGDFNEPKGFAVLHDDFTYEFVDNVVSPHHVKLVYTNGTIDAIGLGYQFDGLTDKEAVKIASENYVKIIIKECKEPKKLDRLHDSMLLVSKNDYKIELIDASEIVEDCDYTKLEENIKQSAGVIDIMKSYVETVSFTDEIKPEKLDNCFETLYHDVAILGR